MLKNNYPEFKEVMDHSASIPCVSITIKLDKEWISLEDIKKKFEVQRLNTLHQVEEHFKAPLSTKFEQLIERLEPVPHKKCLVIYLSPSVASYHYLDLEFEDSLIIDRFFHVNPVLQNKQEKLHFLLVLLNSKDLKIYSGELNRLEELKHGITEQLDDFDTENGEKVSNFSETTKHREIRLKKYLAAVDHKLQVLVNHYAVPCIISGSEKTIGLFRSIAKPNHFYKDYISGNYHDASKETLQTILQPVLASWRVQKDREFKRKIDEAIHAKKLVTGAASISEHLNNKQGKTLLISLESKKEDVPFEGSDDVKDELAFQMMQQGGEVVFLQKGTLPEPETIALIDFY